MSATLLTVQYRLLVPAAEFHRSAASKARAIADTPGLDFKIWGLDPATGRGTSAYLFRDLESAKAFAAGPMIEALRDGPVDELTIGLAPVDDGLSLVTHAAFVLDRDTPPKRHPQE